MGWVCLQGVCPLKSHGPFSAGSAPHASPVPTDASPPNKQCELPSLSPQGLMSAQDHSASRNMRHLWNYMEQPTSTGTKVLHRRAGVSPAWGAESCLLNKARQAVLCLPAGEKRDNKGLLTLQEMKPRHHAKSFTGQEQQATCCSLLC